MLWNVHPSSFYAYACTLTRAVPTDATDGLQRCAGPHVRFLWTVSRRHYNGTRPCQLCLRVGTAFYMPAPGCLHTHLHGTYEADSATSHHYRVSAHVYPSRTYTTHASRVFAQRRRALCLSLLLS